jgi:hypothetical protein
MHWLTVFVMEDLRRCLKNWLPGAYFGSKTP